ncbi:MAG: ABC transporter permease, partial [Acidobacteria bacterium]|nr:ABC transporter permease [Acidobacteriota bacterium]
MHTQSASFREAITGAAASLRASKLRSFLTLLGIILATATLIAVMSVIHGMDVYIAQYVSDMGADGFTVTRFGISFDFKKYLEMQRRNPRLTKEEFQFLKSRSTLVKEWGLETARGVTVTVGREQALGVTLEGMTANGGLIKNVLPADGRFLSDVDDQRRLMLAFIGNDLKEKFFAGTNPIGKTIVIGGRQFQVIGVAKPKGTVFGQSLDNFVWIPAETYFKIYGGRGGMDYN